MYPEVESIHFRVFVCTEPLVASKMANSGKYDAIICLGAVIRGVIEMVNLIKQIQD